MKEVPAVSNLVQGETSSEQDRQQYLVGPNDAIPEPKLSLLEILNKLKQDNEVEIKSVQGPPDNPSLLVIRTTSHHARQLQTQYPVLVEPDTPLSHF